MRGCLAERWLDTTGRAFEDKAKVVYYLSMEFLPGRLLKKNLLNLGAEETCRAALEELDVNLDDLYDCEFEAALARLGTRSCLRQRPDRCPLGARCPARAG